MREEIKTGAYLIKRVELWPLVRVSSVLFLMIGVVVGIFAFLIFPHPSSAGLSFSTRLFSAVLFAFLYSLILVVGIVLVIGLYNFLSQRLNWGVTVHFAEKSLEDNS